MHTTTVRFGAETWAELKAVCDRDGIATAAFIREATVARLARSTTMPQLDRHDRELEELRARVERVERYLSRRATRRP